MVAMLQSIMDVPIVMEAGEPSIITLPETITIAALPDQWETVEAEAPVVMELDTLMLATGEKIAELTKNGRFQTYRQNFIPFIRTI